MDKEIRQKIDQVFLRYELKPEESFDHFLVNAKEKKKRYYSTLCKGKNGTQYFFKILVFGDKSGEKSTKNEIDFYLKTKNNPFLKNITQSFIDYETKKYFWYLRDSVSGKIIGDASELFSEENLVNKISEMALSIIKKLEEFKSFKFETVSSEKYLEQISNSLPEIEKYYDNFWQQITILFSDEKIYCQKNLVLTHGDFHFGNLVYLPPKLVVIDWGNVHYGNMAEDFAKLYISLWQFPLVQQKILKDFIEFKDGNKAELETSIRLMLLFHASDSLKHWSKHKKLGDLKIAGKGFDYFYRLIENLLKDDFSLDKLITD